MGYGPQKKFCEFLEETDDVLMVWQFFLVIILDLHQ
jgi:hypothetical protein